MSAVNADRDRVVTLNGAVLTLRQPVRENAMCSDKLSVGLLPWAFMSLSVWAFMKSQ